MAEIVLGMATSHGPMLSTPSHEWYRRIEFDRKLSELFYRGQTYSFDELVALRANENLEQQILPAVMEARSQACKQSISKLADRFATSKVDVAVIIGNDQMEIFTEENLPALFVYWGAKIDNIPFSEEQKLRLGPGIALAEHGHHADHHEVYPGAPELGQHVIAHLMEKKFDVCSSNSLPDVPTSRSSGIPHAFGFVYRQLFRGAPISNLPVFINTFYHPSRPTLERCIELGSALSDAIRAWDRKVRVAVIASGGLSHFVIDEELDKRMLGYLREGDVQGMRTIPESYFRSGTSELKSWAVAATIMAGHRLKMTDCDYITCYRSLAGTGNAMAFAAWQ